MPQSLLKHGHVLSCIQHAFPITSSFCPLYGFSKSGIFSQQASQKLCLSKPQSSGKAEFPGSSPEFAQGFHS